MGPETREIPHPAREEFLLEEVFGALTDRHRLGIVRTLARSGEAMACGAFQLPVSKSSCTYHFRVLREAGVIRQYYEGTSRLSVLRAEDLEARFPGLLAVVLAG